jgi:glycosyltransferase involved in cell wall biosynthesis
VWRRGGGSRLSNSPLEPAGAVRDGRLDVPAGGRAVARGAVKFHGWTLFSSGPAARVELWLGDDDLGPARLGLPRPDVCRALGLEAGAATGFELAAQLDGWAEGETSLRAVATSAAGERLELAPQRLEIVSPAVARPPSPPREVTPYAPSRAGLQTLVVTHQLDLGGAQLYLMDLLRELLRTAAANPTVVSARDGCLRGELEAMGVPVHVSGPPATDDLAAHLGHVEELAAWAADRDFEAVFVNTATCLATPGAEVAGRLGIPAVWAIHESIEPALLWAHVDAAVRRRATQALGDVAQTLFVAEATRRLFEPATGGRGLAIPYGLDLEPIDERRHGFDREGARRAAGIAADAEVVLCVGAIEPRKGQIPLVQAFDLLAERHPRAQLVFVGARKDSDSEFLAEYAGNHAAGERIRIVPTTPDVHAWFGLADLVVCPSDVESMPRAVLEGMAWELPVLATSVFGLPELIEDGVNGWLCEPRDLAALAAALDRALASGPEQRRRIGAAARSLVERRHSLEDYGREVAELLQRVVAGPRVGRLVDAAAG